MLMSAPLESVDEQNTEPVALDGTALELRVVEGLMPSTTMDRSQLHQMRRLTLSET